jgi:hypothetical protein
MQRNSNLHTSCFRSSSNASSIKADSQTPIWLSSSTSSTTRKKGLTELAGFPRSSETLPFCSIAASISSQPYFSSPPKPHTTFSLKLPSLQQPHQPILLNHTLSHPCPTPSPQQFSSSSPQPARQSPPLSPTCPSQHSTP